MQLNKQQTAAATAADGPVLVLAGAGTGKTRVIIERLAWLVEERGIDPRNLLALTFTNKAAAEMRERFAARLARDRVAAWLGTFHSFGLYVLRQDMDKLGRPKQFTIFDDSDQLSLMKRLVKDLPTKYEKVSPREALSWVSRLKQEVKTPEEDEEDISSGFEETCTLLWKQYHDALSRASALDFDDLLVLMVRLLEDVPEVREKWQQRFKHVLIDEYQDTNRAQYLIAHHLSQGHGNLFAVGDEDQSIYSWRGADINNILDFAEDFPQAEVCRLELNYRSTKAILDAANLVVQNNVNRLGKTLQPVSKESDPVRFFHAEDGEAEARFVVDDLRKRGLPHGEVAVLYRTNGQARLMEEALRTTGVPYTVVGGIKFYSRKEIKDVLGYLRLLVNPNDDESLRRVINVPARGIGGTTLQRFEEYAAERREPILKVLRDLETDETFSARPRKAAAEFVNLIDDLALEAKGDGVEKLVELLLERTGYRDFVQQSDEKDFRTRLEILDEFLASAKEFDKRSGGTLIDFLQELSLSSDVDAWDPNAPQVTLMTCHSAKGLEFNYVYLIGLEEGLLPFGSEYDPSDDVEEERRLCYVAMTRARKGLTLTAARSRMVYGRTHHSRELSRFVGEIGYDRLERVGEKVPVARTPRKAKMGVRPVGGAAAEAATVKTGTKVRHAKFGMGVVMFSSGSGDKLKVKVRFATGRTALLLVKQAPIEILEGNTR